MNPPCDKIKVLHVITRFDKGGSAENTFLTVRGLDKTRFDVLLIKGAAPLGNSAEPEAAFAKAFGTVYGGTVPDRAFTALTDTRFYGLNYNIPSLCFGASGAAMHGFNEYVDLDSLRKSTKATALFIAEWCGVEAI